MTNLQRYIHTAKIPATFSSPSIISIRGIICPKCGTSVRLTAHECENCGWEFDISGNVHRPAVDHGAIHGRCQALETGEISVTGNTYSAVSEPKLESISIVPGTEDPSQAVEAPVTNRGAFLPKNLLSETSETPVCIGWDWAEITGKKGIEFLAKNTDAGQFIWEVKDTGNDDIKEVYTCWRGDWQLFGKLWVGMKAICVRPDWCKFKLENSFCYTPAKELRNMIGQFLEWAGITFKHYARLDTFADFQRTDYRGGMSPQMFMNKVASRQYVFKGKGCKSINKPGKMAVNAKGDLSELPNDNDLEVYGRLGRIETIRVGSRKSGLSISMYNKSAEMRAKVHKPYITEMWKNAGFLEGFDTFRVEFQATKTVKGIYIFDSESNDSVQLDLSHENIDMILHLETYYKCLWRHHFNVAINKKGERFSRMKRVELFDVDHQNYVVLRTSDKLKSTNYIKSGIKDLLKDAVQLQYNGYQISSSELYKQIQRKLDRHDLHKWFADKFPDIILTDKRKGGVIMSYNDILTNKEARRGVLVQGNVFELMQRFSSQ